MGRSESPGLRNAERLRSDPARLDAFVPVVRAGVFELDLVLPPERDSGVLHRRDESVQAGVNSAVGRSRSEDGGAPASFLPATASAVLLDSERYAHAGSPHETERLCERQWAHAQCDCDLLSGRWHRFGRQRPDRSTSDVGSAVLVGYQPADFAHVEKVGAGRRKRLSYEGGCVRSGRRIVGRIGRRSPLDNVDK